MSILKLVYKFNVILFQSHDSFLQKLASWCLVEKICKNSYDMYEKNKTKEKEVDLPNI